MLYARAADLVAVTHAAFIAFLLAGGFVAWRRPRLPYAGYIVRRHRAGTEPGLTAPTASAVGRR